MLGLEIVYTKSPSIVSRKIAEEAVLVPIRQTLGEDPSIFTLNEVGAKIWDLIDGTRSAREICETVSAEFDVDPSVAQQDLLKLLAQLKEIRIIREK